MYTFNRSHAIDVEVEGLFIKLIPYMKFTPLNNKIKICRKKLYKTKKKKQTNTEKGRSGIFTDLYAA